MPYLAVGQSLDKRRANNEKDYRHINDYSHFGISWRSFSDLGIGAE
jgi:hypothetical protein